MSRRRNTEHEIAAAFLGVWALDACSAEEAERIMAHLPDCADCTAEAVRLRSVANWIGTATPPPPGLRVRTLERAMARRAAASPCPGYAAPYAAQVSVLDLLLADLTAAEWESNVIYAWSVQDVVAHLTATDGMVAARLGVAVEPPFPPGEAISGGSLEHRTAALILQERGRMPRQTRTAWRTQADALCRRLPADRTWRMDGIHLRIADAVVTRAFETWVHADDIARAVGRELPPPLPEHLHPIAGLGVRSLPKALAPAWAGRPAVAAEVVLSGSGGGEWVVGLGGKVPETPDPVVRVEMDVLEFCFLAGGRRDPAMVAAVVSGDEDLGRDLLAAASAFSGP